MSKVVDPKFFDRYKELREKLVKAKENALKNPRNLNLTHSRKSRITIDDIVRKPIMAHSKKAVRDDHPHKSFVARNCKARAVGDDSQQKLKER